MGRKIYFRNQLWVGEKRKRGLLGIPPPYNIAVNFSFWKEKDSHLFFIQKCLNDCKSKLPLVINLIPTVPIFQHKTHILSALDNKRRSCEILSKLFFYPVFWHIFHPKCWNQYAKMADGQVKHYSFSTGVPVAPDSWKNHSRRAPWLHLTVVQLCRAGVFAVLPWVHQEQRSLSCGKTQKLKLVWLGLLVTLHQTWLA